MATVHIPDQFLKAVFDGTINLALTSYRTILINYSSYDRVTDYLASHLTEITGSGYTSGGNPLSSLVVAYDTTNHNTTITYTPAQWTGATTISATGCAIVESVSGRIAAVADFGGTVSSSGGTFTITTPIVHQINHF